MPSLDKLVPQLKQRLDTFVDEFNDQLSTQIAINTPVYDGPRTVFYKRGQATDIVKGELLGSWSVGINSRGIPGSPTEDNLQKAQELANQAATGGAGDTFFYTNHADYAREVEYNITPQISDMKLKPTSLQYTRKALDMVPSFIEAAADKVRK